MSSDNKYMSKYVNYRYLRLKIQALEYKGNKCIKCGFDKYYALTFHHRNPEEKEFSWDKLRKQSWDTIQKELNKCDVLCHNCHSVAHYNNNELDEMKLFFATRKKSKEPKYVNCLICGTKFTVTRDRNKFCKTECYKQWQDLNGKRIPDNIKDLLKEKSLDNIASGIGISRKNLAKKLTKMGLWPISQDILIPVSTQEPPHI